MTPFTTGFVDELIKTGGAGGALLSLVKRHPWGVLGGGLVLGATGLAAKSGYEKGLAGDEEDAGHLSVTRQAKQTGVIAPTRVAYTNYHKLFPEHHKPDATKWRQLHENYNERAFRKA